MRPLSTILSLLTLLMVSAGNAGAQSDEASNIRSILEKDSLFWVSYNKCDTSNYEQFFYKDVEFYHDKGGILLGADALASSLKKNLCSNTSYRLRRDPVKGTIKTYSLFSNGVMYGAILSGEHLFYIIENGKPPQLDGHASFTHLWLVENGVWRMKRILSYAHGPAAVK